MDEKTQKTLENAMAICAEHAKNAATNTSTTLKERQAVDASKATLDKKIADAEVNLAEKLSKAQASAEATEEAQKAVAQYVDVTFPAKVENAENRLANATSEAAKNITNKANDALSAISTHAGNIVTALDVKADSVIAEIDAKVERAETAKGDALTSTWLDGR